MRTERGSGSGIISLIKIFSSYNTYRKVFFGYKDFLFTVTISFKGQIKFRYLYLEIERTHGIVTLVTYDKVAADDITSSSPDVPSGDLSFPYFMV